MSTLSSQNKEMIGRIFLEMPLKAKCTQFLTIDHIYIYLEGVASLNATIAGHFCMRFLC